MAHSICLLVRSGFMTDAGRPVRPAFAVHRCTAWQRSPAVKRMAVPTGCQPRSAAVELPAVNEEMGDPTERARFEINNRIRGRLQARTAEQVSDTLGSIHH